MRGDGPRTNRARSSINPAPVALSGDGVEQPLTALRALVVEGVGDVDILVMTLATGTSGRATSS